MEAWKKEVSRNSKKTIISVQLAAKDHGFVQCGQNHFITILSSARARICVVVYDVSIALAVLFIKVN